MTDTSPRTDPAVWPKGRPVRSHEGANWVLFAGIMLFLGVGQIFGAYSIWRGGEVGRWFGIAVAGLNAIGALMSISAYPFWGLCVFILDVLVIYGLANYGGDPRVVE